VEDIRHRQIYGSGVATDEKLEQVLESIRFGNYGSAAIFEPLLSKKDSLLVIKQVPLELIITCCIQIFLNTLKLWKKLMLFSKIR
jgi:hypothetical protein